MDEATTKMNGKGKLRLTELLLVAIPFTPMEPALAYRPFDSTDAGVVDPHVVEIEFGPYAYIDEPGARSHVAPDLTVNIGLSRRWEAVIEGERMISRADADRRETFESALLLKSALREGALQRRTGLSVATEFGVLLPTRNNDEGYGGTVLLISSYRSVGMTLHANAGITSRDGDVKTFTGLIIEGRPEMAIRPVAEFTYEHNYAQGESEVAALLGLIWRARNDLSFDLAVRTGHGGEGWTYEGRVGVTWATSFARSS